VIAQSRSRKIRLGDVLLLTLLLVLLMLILVMLVSLISPLGRQYLGAWNSGGPIPGLEDRPDARQVVVSRIVGRFTSPWTPLFLAVLVVTTVLLVVGSRGSDRPAYSEKQRPEMDYVLLLVVTGSLLTLAVEFVYLRDVFGTRMNTVFKFYFQAWVMWGCVGAYALVRGLSGGRVWAWLATLLVCAGLVYTTLAIPNRMGMHDEPATLDGAAYLRLGYAAADFAAIDWLNENVEGMPVLLEAPGDGYQAYVYEGRVSAFTGLPTLLGWGGHQHQWRGDYEQPALREPDIETLFTTTDLAETRMLLERYEIEYIFVGPEEWSRYPADGLTKFVEISRWVYSADGVTIYHYDPAILGATGEPLEPGEWQPGGAAP
jgi:YYY domain-containing protein